MRKIQLDVETLRVSSFATEEGASWTGTVVANEATGDVIQCAGTKTLGCPITWSCPSTTP